MVTSRPSWFAVLVLDPLTDRLARLPRPRNPMAPALPLAPTPAALTRLGTVAGLLSAVCLAGRAGGPATACLAVAGAALFSASLFLHRRAELRGGAVEGAARLRDLCCTLGLVGGQFALTHRIGCLYFGLAVLMLDLLYTANARQTHHTWAALRARAAAAEERRTLERARLESGEREYAGRVLAACLDGPPTVFGCLTWRGERPVPVSRADFSLVVFVLGPLAGLTVWPGHHGFTGIARLAVPAGLLLLLAEAVLAVRLWLLTRDAALVLTELDRAAASKGAAGPVTVPTARTEPDRIASVTGGLR
jgi:hypothetical protein